MRDFLCLSNSGLKKIPRLGDVFNTNQSNSLSCGDICEQVQTVPPNDTPESKYVVPPNCLESCDLFVRAANVHRHTLGFLCVVK